MGALPPLWNSYILIIIYIEHKSCLLVLFILTVVFYLEKVSCVLLKNIHCWEATFIV